MYFTEIDTGLLIEPQRTFNSLTWSPTRCFSIRYCRFCPSMFLYLMTVIPCDWIAKRQVLDCVASNQDENTACLRAVNNSAVLYHVSIKANHVRRVLRRAPISYPEYSGTSKGTGILQSLSWQPTAGQWALGLWVRDWKCLGTLGTRLVSKTYASVHVQYVERMYNCVSQMSTSHGPRRSLDLIAELFVS